MCVRAHMCEKVVRMHVCAFCIWESVCEREGEEVHEGGHMCVRGGSVRDEGVESLCVLSVWGSV